MNLLHYEQVPQWDRFVQNHPSGSVFHTTCMIRSLATTRYNRPFAYAAVDSSGDICALLVATKVVTVHSVGLPFASRSIMHAEPLCLPTAAGRDGLRRLLSSHDQYMKRRTLFCEIRPIHSLADHADIFQEAGYAKAGYLNYEFPLSSCADKMFSQVSGKRRNNIRVAAKKGVEIRSAISATDRADFYKLICASYSRSKLPLVEASLFESTVTCMPQEAVRIFTAWYQSQPIASGCFLGFKGRVTCWYAGTLRVPGVPAMTAVFWHAMQTFAQEGYKIFDFAGAGWEGEDYGPGKFKSKFGGRETNFGRFRKVYSPWKLSVASVVYDRVRRFMAPKATVTFDNEFTRST